MASFTLGSASASMSPQEALFLRALSIPVAKRSDWLADACSGDSGLRNRIQAMLRAHDEAGSLLDRPAASRESAARCATLAEEGAGDRIGRYKLLQKIGEGGCGVVYMAEQEESVSRRVALKVIKLGMDTRAVIARFEAERQALARMEHPNIARVLDAGATPSGRPYFVMELVRGLRITDYCDLNNLPTERRLELFIKVCHAIQHAHQKGIIHRDIKPSNILVTLHDGEPVPKVIDFGIAKATQGRLTEQTLFTAFEQFIGTPAYVSPEQAEMSGLDVDTRSDIYSLGVLLYELLAGRTPLDSDDLMRAGLDEMRRRIREAEPPRPSHRLRTLNDSDRTTVAHRRGTDAPRLTVQLRGDLDWIVMRCLEKDRARRYESPSALAADLQRHLRNEPVTARPPSTAYLLQKLIRRHRVAFFAGVTIAVTLAAGCAFSTALYLRERNTLARARVAEEKAREEKLRAELATSHEAQLRETAVAEQQRAEAEAARRVRLATFLSGTMKDMALLISLGADRRGLRAALDQALTLRQELSDQPESQAGLEEALAAAYFQLGDFPRAEDLFLDAVALRRRIAGHDAAVAQSLNFLGRVYSGQSRWTDAEAAHREALALQQRLEPAQPADVARTLSTLGAVLGQQAKYRTAEAALRTALEQQRPLGSAGAADLAATLTRLGSVLTQEGRVNEAEAALREALQITRTVSGPRSLETATVLNHLAVAIVSDQRRLPEVISLYRAAAAIRRQPDSNGTNPTATSAGDASRIGTAIPPAVSPAVLGIAPTSVETMLGSREWRAEIENALREARRFAESQYAHGSAEEAFYLALTGWVLLHEQRYAEAESSLRQCLAIREQLRPDDWSVFHARHMLGAALAGQGRFESGEALLVGGYTGMKARVTSLPHVHLPRLGESVRRIIDAYTAVGRADDAARWQQEYETLTPEMRDSVAVNSESPLGDASPGSAH